MIIENPIIRCNDDYLLGATLFLPENEPKAIIQINSATATPQAYYHNFAKFLVEEAGYATITFDYRGIGASKPKEGLKNFPYHYIDWAILDMAAVTDFLNSKFSKLPILHFSHSVGGQMIGLLPNIHLISGLVTVGSAAGSTRNTTFKQSIISTFFFRFLRPTSNLLFGYGKFKTLGLMEDLPKNLMNSWSDWCSVSDYFFDPKYYHEIKEIDGYKSLKIPIEIIAATDDAIATKKNTENFWKHAKSSQGINISYLNPASYGIKEIGHFGFFRKKFKNTLWPIGLSLLQKQIISLDK